MLQIPAAPFVVAVRRALLGVALALASAAVLAQAWPARPLRLVVPYPPGASTDMLGRAVAQKLSDSLGQNVIVENRAGASGSIGSDYVAKQPGDGYTFLLGTDATHTTNSLLAKTFPYDPVKDFTPLTAAVQNHIVLTVNPSVPANNVRELVEYARRNPGRASYGSAGTGSPHHLSGEMLQMLTGARFVHIPYKGGGPAVTDLLGGQIPITFSSLSAVAQHIRSGKLRVLGVVENKRYAGLPDVPTIGESIPGFEISSFLAFFGPAGIPAPIQNRLHTEIVKALQAPDVNSRFEAAGFSLIGSTPAQLAEMVKNGLEQRAKLLKAAGIKPE